MQTEDKPVARNNVCKTVILELNAQQLPFSFNAFNKVDRPGFQLAFMCIDRESDAVIDLFLKLF